MAESPPRPSVRDVRAAIVPSGRGALAALVVLLVLGSAWFLVHPDSASGILEGSWLPGASAQEANNTTGEDPFLANVEPGDEGALVEAPVDERSSLLTRVAWLAGLTVAFFLLWGLLTRGRAASFRIVERVTPAEGKPIKIGSLKILSTDWVRLSGMRFVHSTDWVLRLILIILYIPAVLILFSPTERIYQAALAYGRASLATIGQSIVGYLPNLVYIIVLVVVTNVLLKGVGFVFDEVSVGRIHIRGFYKSWAKTTYKLVRFFAIVFVFILVFPRLPGSDSTAFQGVSLFLGALITIGGSAAVANIVSGVVLTYTRAFERGDRVTIADTEGDVILRTLLVTKVRTIKNIDVTIPNAQVLANHIINHSAQEEISGLILHTTVTIGYDVPWRKVRELLLEAARRTEGAVDKPEPFVHITELSDFHVSYQLNITVEDASTSAQTKSDLHGHIQDAFQEAQVEILSPHHRAHREITRPQIPPKSDPTPPIDDDDRSANPAPA